MLILDSKLTTGTTLLRSFDMKREMWFYEIRYHDGRIVRRTNVPKYLAHSAHDFCKYEMALMGIQSVTYGVMK